ncbi:hypothetical protein ABIF38_000523 [Bradyrhizobium japonicum]|nr:hypothetical protein [Bradyrhizobium elkanii]MCS3519780.1 hypothetical protein [Bradyrhizobium elkanii]MCS3572500.1 hypothetical protein [Bradyrhizobium elkanii]MCS3586016.1 hypothetical protein [Bradyrhizobium elkanii]MCS3624250.1 hypothetical protein [Bradyrhizobium elkanii]
MIRNRVAIFPRDKRGTLCAEIMLKSESQKGMAFRRKAIPF